MSEDKKTGFEDIQQRNEETYFRKICEGIAELPPLKYAELRTWLLMQPTIEDWKGLMSS